MRNRNPLKINSYRVYPSDIELDFFLRNDKGQQRYISKAIFDFENSKSFLNEKSTIFTF